MGAKITKNQNQTKFAVGICHLDRPNLQFVSEKSVENSLKTSLNARI